jgi:hypothetical protein
MARNGGAFMQKTQIVDAKGNRALELLADILTQRGNSPDLGSFAPAIQDLRARALDLLGDIVNHRGSSPDVASFVPAIQELLGTEDKTT